MLISTPHPITSDPSDDLVIVGSVFSTDRVADLKLGGERMLTNRSIPRSTVIPELEYPDVGEAIRWLCAAFGFTLRLRIANHRAQLNVGEGAVVLMDDRQGLAGRSAVMVRVEDVDRHFERAKERGARIVRLPADYPYGERQYTAEDFAGHRWTFSQSIADVAPEEWGGTPGQL